MKQRYHTIIKPEPNGWFVGWVEEIPGTITQARTLEECRDNLRDALELMLQTHRDEARIPLDSTCIQEALDIDVPDPASEAGPPGSGATSAEAAPLGVSAWHPASHAYPPMA